MNNFYTGNGLLYENNRRGRYEDSDSVSFEANIHISIEPIKLKITVEEETNDELRPLFRKAV